MRKILVATGALLTLFLSGLSVFAQSQSRDDILKEIEAKRAELSALENLLLSPSEADQATYADFLRQPDTGLFRLLPREKFDSEVYKANKKTITMRGGGAYYSFGRKTHEYGYGSDIELDQDHLATGFFGGQAGLLTNVGDVPLESVNIEIPAAQSLAMPSAELKTCRTRVPLKSNSTYLLRSSDPLRSDVLVAFKVVRVDSDGSVIILWKLLKSFPVKQVAEK